LYRFGEMVYGIINVDNEFQTNFEVDLGVNLC
jgi:hypothetical protein